MILKQKFYCTFSFVFFVKKCCNLIHFLFRRNSEHCLIWLGSCSTLICMELENVLKHLKLRFRFFESRARQRHDEGFRVFWSKDIWPTHIWSTRSFKKRLVGQNDRAISESVKPWVDQMPVGQKVFDQNTKQQMKYKVQILY
jgi:hypothetical protein